MKADIYYVEPLRKFPIMGGFWYHYYEICRDVWHVNYRISILVQ